VWLHNKLKIGGSLADALGAIKTLHPLRAHQKATALEALERALQQQKNSTLGELVEKYGTKANQDNISADRVRLSLQRRIVRAWRRRRDLVGAVVGPLSCYNEIQPYVDANGLIVDEPLRCNPPGDCCLAREMKRDQAALIKLRDALATLPAKPETSKRLAAIKDMIRIPKRDISDQGCRRLGDAVFAFFAPIDSVILTTNVLDHRPLAEALGKLVETP
jgi:hypothetical protein